jgi:exodeoxyribonuclease V beta subunit
LRAWELPLTFEGKPLRRAKAIMLSARATATEITRLLHASHAGLIRLGERPLQAGDIAVLVPSRVQGSAVKRELGLLKIGCAELSRESVFQTVEAEEVEQVLLTIHNPARETSLRAALATELLGYDAEAIVSLSGNESGLLAWLERFANYRKAWLNEGVGIMYRRMLREEGVSTRMLKRVDGERRLSNLLHLGELLHQAATMHPSPDALLRWLSQQRSDASEDEAAQVRLESDRNLVQIVTIHKSKGLEFPVVFCPFLWDGRLKSSHSRVEGREYHDRQGRAVIDFTPYEKGSTRLKEIENSMRLEEASEQLRLIYVALTRAVYRCYLVVGTYLATARSKNRHESTRSLLNWLVAGKSFSAAQWFESEKDANGISNAWRSLAAENAAHLVFEPLPTDAARPLSRAGPEPASLAALAAPPRITPAWQFTSFSQMTRQVQHEEAVTDHDLLLRPNVQRPYPGTPRLAAKAQHPGNPGLNIREPLEAGPPSDLPCTDILRFPRGAGAGTCLHAIFEHVDFTDRSGWAAAVEDALLAHPQAEPVSMTSPPRQLPMAALPRQASTLQSAHFGQPDGPRNHLATMVLQMLSDVLSTPLPGGVILGELSRGQRLNELGFCLPAPRLGAGALQRTLESMNYPLSRLMFGQVEGYLRGSIDMVFAHSGRYYLVDWKSNHLGYTVSDYGPAALELAMAENGYFLQLLLYALATTRYLRLRLPGYTHATHFGGVYYLFVRGIRPAWVLPGGSPSGVYHHLPSAETLARLDRLFAEPESPLPDPSDA